MDFYWKKEWTTPAVVGVVSFAAGVGTGILAYRYKVDRDVDRAVDAFRDFGEAVGKVKVAPFVVPDSKDVEVIDWPKVVFSNKGGLDFSHEIETGEVAQPEVQPEPEPEPETQNVFVDESWNQEEEDANRSPDSPYVISADEFFDRSTGFAQQTLEWYEGDQILADENNVPIYGEGKIVGRLEFGRGSRDPDTVYVRNHKLRAEYEIVRNPGSFQMEVYGIQAEAEAEQDELKHSNAVLKFRDTD